MENEHKNSIKSTYFLHNLCAEDMAMQKEMKPAKNKIPKITEEEYLQYVTSLKEKEDTLNNQAPLTVQTQTATSER